MRPVGTSLLREQLDGQAWPRGWKQSVQRRSLWGLPWGGEDDFLVYLPLTYANFKIKRGTPDIIIRFTTGYYWFSNHVNLDFWFCLKTCTFLFFYLKEYLSLRRWYTTLSNGNTLECMINKTLQMQGNASSYVFPNIQQWAHRIKHGRL